MQTKDDFPTKQLEGIVEITTSFGVYQHVDKTGRLVMGAYPYSNDDNARYLEIWCEYGEKFDGEWFKYRLPEVLLDFAIKSVRSDGLSDNYRNIAGEFIECPEGKLYDVYGRHMWSLAKASSCNNEEIARGARELFKKQLDAGRDIILEKGSPHALAYLIGAMATRLKSAEKIGESITSEVLDIARIQRDAVKKLSDFYHEHSDVDWDWPDDSITYCGAVIPHAMFLASQTAQDKTYFELAKRWTRTFTSASFKDKMFWPVGNNENEEGVCWYPKKGKKSLYDQQTIEAGRAALLYKIAYDITKNPEYLERWGQCLDWFFGKNSRKVCLLQGKGVCDGVTENSLGYNENQGAESRLSFLLGESTIHC